MTILIQLFLTDLVLIGFGMTLSSIFWESSTVLMPKWWKMIFGSAILLMFPIMFAILMMLIWS